MSPSTSMQAGATSAAVSWAVERETPEQDGAWLSGGSKPATQAGLPAVVPVTVWVALSAAVEPLVSPRRQ